MRTTAEYVADVSEEHADVRPAGTRDQEIDVGCPERGQLEPVYADRTGCGLQASPLRAASYSCGRRPSPPSTRAGLEGLADEAVIAERTSSSVEDTGRSAVVSPSASSMVVSTRDVPTPRTSSAGHRGTAAIASPGRRPGRAARSPSDRACPRAPPSACRASVARHRRRRATSSRRACRRAALRDRSRARRRAGRRHGRRHSQRGDEPRDRSGGDRARGVAAASRCPPPPKAAIAARSCSPRARADLEPSIRPLLEHGRDVHVADRPDEVDRSSVSSGPTPASARSACVRYVHTRSTSVSTVARASATASTRGIRDGCPRTGPAPWRGSDGCSRSAAATRSVSGVVASYWKRPVSVTRPAYGRPRWRRASRRPSQPISRNTISHVEEAAGSINGIVPRPSFERWWSIQITSVALDAAEPSRPSQGRTTRSRT